MRLMTTPPSEPGAHFAVLIPGNTEHSVWRHVGTRSGRDPVDGKLFDERGDVCVFVSSDTEVTFWQTRSQYGPFPDGSQFLHLTEDEMDMAPALLAMGAWDRWVKHQIGETTDER